MMHLYSNRKDVKQFEHNKHNTRTDTEIHDLKKFGEREKEKRFRSFRTLLE